MKRLTLVLTMVAVATIGASAQKFGLGLKGGLNFASLDVKDTKSKTGFHVGAYAVIGIGGFAVQPELLYSAKGAKDVDLGYVEIPILLKKSFAKIVNIHVGPQFGILTSAKTGNTDTKEKFKNSDISAVFGAGLDLPGGLSAGARYILGLSNINGTSDKRGDSKNRTFQIYIGYRLVGKG